MKLTNVLDLTDRACLHQLGLDLDALDDDGIMGFPPFQRVGGAAHFLGIEGLLVPSVRLDGGVNLVIFTDNVQFNGISEISKVAEQPFESQRQQRGSRLGPPATIPGAGGGRRPGTRS